MLDCLSRGDRLRARDHKRPGRLSRGDRYAVSPMALMAFATGMSKLQGEAASV